MGFTLEFKIHFPAGSSLEKMLKDFFKLIISRFPVEKIYEHTAEAEKEIMVEELGKSKVDLQSDHYFWGKDDKSLFRAQITLSHKGETLRGAKEIYEAQFECTESPLKEQTRELLCKTLMTAPAKLNAKTIVLKDDQGLELMLYGDSILSILDNYQVVPPIEEVKNRVLAELDLVFPFIAKIPGYRCQLLDNKSLFVAKDEIVSDLELKGFVEQPVDKTPQDAIVSYLRLLNLI